MGFYAPKLLLVTLIWVIQFHCVLSIGETFTRMSGPYTCPGNTVEEIEYVPTVQYCEEMCISEVTCTVFVITDTNSCLLKSSCNTLASSSNNVIGFPLSGAAQDGGRQFSRLLSPYICMSEKDETVGTSVNIPTADECEKECLGTIECAAFVHFYIPGGKNGMMGMCVLKKSCVEFEASPFPTVMGLPLAEAEPFKPPSSEGTSDILSATDRFETPTDVHNAGTGTTGMLGGSEDSATSTAGHQLGRRRRTPLRPLHRHDFHTQMTLYGGLTQRRPEYETPANKLPFYIF